MIDLKSELQNYPPINLANFENGKNEIPDSIRNSITLYNKALESIRMSSEDIAIIELKKAVSMNPDFFEAMNLLGLCYSYTNEHEKAADMFERVVAGENNSVKALKYLSMLGAGDGIQGSVPKKGRKMSRAVRESASAAREAVKAAGQGIGAFREGPGVGSGGGRSGGAAGEGMRASGGTGRAGLAAGRESTRSGRLQSRPTLLDSLKIYGRRDALKYFAGLAAGVLIMLLIGLGTRGTPVEPDAAKNPQDNSKQLTEELALYRSKYEDLNSEHELLKKNLETANASVGYYRSAIKLYEAESLLNKKDYEGAADLLILLRAADFQGEEKEKFGKLYADIMPQAAWTAYQNGLSLVSPQKKYQEALDKLNKVQLYQEDFEKMDAVLYYTGKCYQQLNDSRNAVAAFQKLLEKYPRSRYAGWAKTRVAELTKLP